MRKKISWGAFAALHIMLAIELLYENGNPASHTHRESKVRFLHIAFWY